MAKLEKRPAVAAFRRSLDEYLTAAKGGEHFTVRRYSTPLAEVGPVIDMPQELQPKAARVRFTTARDEFPSITKLALQGRAVVITKLVRGPHMLPKRGRRKTAVARDEREIAAIWPVPQYAIAGHFENRLRNVEKEVEGFGHLLREFVRQFEPLLSLLAKSNTLQDEIDEKRRQADNLDKTIQRLTS